MLSNVTSHSKPRLTLSRRTLLFLGFFLLTIFVQLLITDYQSRYIIEPLNGMTDQVQAVSQFLEVTGNTLDELQSYRWDYGDRNALADKLRQSRELSRLWLRSIDRDISRLTRSQYIKANAHEAMARSFDGLLGEFLDLMGEGDDAAASRLYYSEIILCGSYLTEYSESLINELLQGNQEQSYRIRRLSRQIHQAQIVIFALAVTLGVILFFYVRKTLSVFRSMEEAAVEISKGNFEVPDIASGTDDEVRSLTDTFNEMKHSMKATLRLLEEKNELETLLERGQLQMLRSQVDPHFLFNTLNVIKFYSEEEDAPRTGEMITALARLFRYSLESDEPMVPLARELIIVEEYYKLCKARFRDKVNLTVKYSPGLDVTELLVPPFILQPVVENSFRHGLGPKEDPGEVCVAIAREEDVLVITISDDGVGMTEEKLSEVLRSIEKGGEGHIGLYNAAARLKLSSERAGLEIKSAPGSGTTVILTLEYVEQEAEDDQDTDCR